MVNLRTIAISAFAAYAWCVAPALAIPTYEYRFDQSNYSVAPGGTVPVTVYLRETYSLADPTLLDAEGLFGTGVRIDFSIPPWPSDPATIFAPSDISYNPAFDGFSLVDLLPGDSGGFTATVDFSTAPVTGTSGSGFFEIILGTFNFTAGLAPGEVTNIRATDFGATQDNITGTFFTVLDGLIGDANATITVQGTAVMPEPSTWAAWIIAGAIGLAGSRRLSPRLMAR